MIGAGIGLTPCVSILTSLTKYRWKLGYNPEILHFYWVVRQNEVESFQWLVHMLTEIAYEMKNARRTNMVDGKYMLEINIYVTGVDRKRQMPVSAMYKAPRNLEAQAKLRQFEAPDFKAEELYSELLNPNPANNSRDQVKIMDSGVKSKLQSNGLWIWDGRPHWDEIFKDVKSQRQHRGTTVGACACIAVNTSSR